MTLKQAIQQLLLISQEHPDLLNIDIIFHDGRCSIDTLCCSVDSESKSEICPFDEYENSMKEEAEIFKDFNKKVIIYGIS